MERGCRWHCERSTLVVAGFERCTRRGEVEQLSTVCCVSHCDMPLTNVRQPSIVR